MRKLVMIAATALMASAFVATAASRGQASEGPWCIYVNGDQTQDCSKASLRACESEFEFGGSSCGPNPNYPGAVTRGGRQ
jgi:Protein of unknown function (DUF3551)